MEVNQGQFLIAFYHSGTPEEIEQWLNERAISTTLTRVITMIPKDEEDWSPDWNECVVSVRVEWNSVQDEVAYSAGLRRHIAELNRDATDDAEMYGFNPTEYAYQGTYTEAVIDLSLGTDFVIKTGPNRG
ncbi:MAG: hypothetical protein ACXWPK_19915 [Isosphaeraceae bacterium]